MKVKQEDIAKKLGISRTTVARALNDSGSIKNSRKEEIIKLAEEMGYIKNTVGSVLATKKEKSIYVFAVKSLNKHYLQEIYKGLKRVENEYNYLKFNFKFIETEISKPNEQVDLLINVLENENVDGVIITPLMKKEIHEIVNNYSKKISFMMLDSFLCDGVPFVGSNYYYNAQTTANFIDKVLRENEKILLFNAHDDNISSISYYNGFKDSIKKTNKDVIAVGMITKEGNTIYPLIKPYINDEIIAIYAPRFTNILVNELIAQGIDFNKIKIIAQSKGLEMQEYLNNNKVIAIVEEMLDIVAYQAGKYMIEHIYNNKDISNIKEYIEPKIIINNNYK